MTLKQLFTSTSLIILLLACSMVSNASEGKLKTVNLASDKIRYLGTNYVYHTSPDNKSLDNNILDNSTFAHKQVSFTRHSQAVLALPKKSSNFNSDKAQTNAGIAMNFATDSNALELSFAALPKINRGADIALYENNQFIKNFKFNNKKKNFSISFDSQQQDAISEYKIVLPSLANLAIRSLRIEANSRLTELTTKRKAKYIALGDSISHGVGQGSASYLTYPYLLADGLNLELFNLAVGGAQVSPPTAEMLTDFDDIDLITVLVGYNDWNAPNADIKVFKRKYNTMLDSLLALHPESKIYCITPLFTKRKTAKNSDLPIQAYRDTIIALVKEKQKKSSNKISLIHGDKISSVDNLRADKPSDPVHLGIPGAKLFAQQLISIIK